MSKQEREGANRSEQEQAGSMSQKEQLKLLLVTVGIHCRSAALLGSVTTSSKPTKVYVVYCVMEKRKTGHVALR